VAENDLSKESEKSNDESSFAKRKFNASSVKKSAEPVNPVHKEEKGITLQEKNDPLVVVDGKAIKYSALHDYLQENKDAVEGLSLLSNPLYIINGVEYTEEELFGRKPTSPYFPLNEQEIISTTVFQGESATNLYGEKGEKGVVVITTKNGKPLKK
jgi:hypothetical protein